MTTKRKLKSNHQLDKLLDSVLFVKQYEFHSPVPIADVMQCLQALSQEKAGWFRHDLQYMVNSQASHDQYVFDIYAIQGQQVSAYAYAHARGIIYSNDDETILEGDIRFGRIYLFFTFFWVIIILLGYANLPNWMLLMFMILPATFFLQALRRRNLLLQKIQQIVMQPIVDDTSLKLKQTN